MHNMSFLVAIKLQRVAHTGRLLPMLGERRFAEGCRLGSATSIWHDDGA